MPKLSPETTTNVSERRLVFIFLAIVALGIVDVAGILIAAAAGVRSIWPIFGMLPLLCFPLALILILVTLTLSIVRRGREARHEQLAQKVGARSSQASRSK